MEFQNADMQKIITNSCRALSGGCRPLHYPLKNIFQISSSARFFVYFSRVIGLRNKKVGKRELVLQQFQVYYRRVRTAFPDFQRSRIFKFLFRSSWRSHIFFYAGWSLAISSEFLTLIRVHNINFLINNFAHVQLFYLQHDYFLCFFF